MGNEINRQDTPSTPAGDLSWDLPLGMSEVHEKNTEPALDGLGTGLHSSQGGFLPKNLQPGPDYDEQINDYLGFMHRAVEADKLQKSSSLISAKVTDQLPNGLLPEIKKLVVPSDATLYLLSERHAPVELEPGDYEVSRLGLGGGLDNSFKAYGGTSGAGSNTQRSGVLICEVRRKSFPFTITLPDENGFSSLLDRMKKPENSANRKQHVEDLAKELGRVFEESRLQTQDGICTGVRVQLDVRVKDPRRLIETYCRFFVKRLEQNYKDLDLRVGTPAVDPGLASKLLFPLSLLKQVVFGAQQRSGAQLRPIKLDQVYRKIRLEVADALRDAIRLETARDLIEQPALVRERVTSSLEQHVGRSLGLFGLTIQRVVSVECVSPEYNRMLVERGRLKLRREKIEDRETEAGIEHDEQTIDTRRFEDQVREQNLRSRHATRESEETNRDAIQEQTKTQRVDDLRKIEGIRSDLQRQQEIADVQRDLRLRNADADLEIRKNQDLADLRLEEQRILLQNQKMEALLGLEMRRDEHLHRLEQDALDQSYRREVGRLELLFNQQMKTNEAEMNSRLVFLEKYAGLSKDVDEGKLLLIAMASNPKLAKPFVEATRAKGKDELIAKMGEFKNELVAAHGKEDKLVHQLMQEGIRQLGGVVMKHVEKPVTQINANSVNVKSTEYES